MVYLFHTNLSPSSITLAIYRYRLRLPICTLPYLLYTPYYHVSIRRATMSLSLTLTIFVASVRPKTIYHISVLIHCLSNSQTLESLLDTPIASTYGGLTLQMHNMPIVLKKSRLIRRLNFFIGRLL